MLKLSLNHVTLWLHNDDDDDKSHTVFTESIFVLASTTQQLPLLQLSHSGYNLQASSVITGLMLYW